MSRFSWARKKSQLRYMKEAAAFELKREGVVHATVQQDPNGNWFSYGPGWNTSSTPMSLHDAKDDALSRVRKT